MTTITTKQVSSTVEDVLLKEAQAMTGAGQSATLRLALKHFVDTHPSAAAPRTPVVTAAVAPAAAAGKSPATWKKMEAGGRVSSLALMRKARNALDDAIVYLVGEEAVANVATKQQLRITIGDLEGKLKKVEAKLLAYFGNKLTMAPPSPATVARVGELAGQVSLLTQKAQQADLVVTAVNKVFKIWTSAVPQG